MALFKIRHLLDEGRVDGIFSPQPRRKDCASPGNKILELIAIFQVS